LKTLNVSVFESIEDR